MAIWGTPSGSSEFDESLLKDVTTSRDFKLAHPELVKRFIEAVEGYKRMFPNRSVLVTCTYRSPTEQRRLFAKGRFGSKEAIVTKCDGFTKKSMHNYFPARAIDCAILDGGKLSYDEAMFYPLGNIARECKLSWGGFWAGDFQDVPHFDLGKDFEY